MLWVWEPIFPIDIHTPEEVDAVLSKMLLHCDVALADGTTYPGVPSRNREIGDSAIGL